MKDIFKTIKEAASFRTLLSALEVVDLTETLSGPGPFTLFAPAEVSFKKLPAIKHAELFQNKWKLRQLLASHVMADKVMSADIESMGIARMMNDKVFNIVVDNIGVMIDGKKIIQSDILCSNGVIHAVDGLFLTK
jgi:uncharacterized surface protein with fasciclin (FAS1) repeats